ncbi:MAG: hypothetical protein ACREXW_12830 [Gammaproteobacteria bacterium]
MAFANPLGGTRRVEPKPFSQFIHQLWLAVLLATWSGIVRSQEQVVRGWKRSPVVADRLPVGATDVPFSGIVIRRKEG